MKLSLYILLFLASATFVAAEQFPDFPHHKEMQLVIAADKIEYNGIPTIIYQFQSNLSIQEIINFYRDEWDEISEVDYGSVKLLNHREGDFLLTVQIEPNDFQATHGILSISPLFGLLDERSSKLKKISEKVGEDFPKLPNTKFISDIEANELGGRSRSLLFSNSYDIDRNLRFYRNEFERDGWISTLSGEQPQMALSMIKNGVQLNMSFTREANETYGVAVFLP